MIITIYIISLVYGYTKLIAVSIKNKHEDKSLYNFYMIIAMIFLGPIISFLDIKEYLVKYYNKIK